MIEEKAISCICHLLHLQKTYSHSCHHKCSSTNKNNQNSWALCIPIGECGLFHPRHQMCSWKLCGWNQTIIAHQNELTIIAYYRTQQSSFCQETIVHKNFWPPWLQKYNCLCNWSLTPEDDNFTKEGLFPSDIYLKNRGMCIPVTGTKKGITYCFLCAIHLEIKV